jgi:membrane protein implicated in regulation of membrane protease activity
MVPLTFPQLTVIAGLIFIFAELIIGIQTGFDLVVIGAILLLGGFLGLATNSLTITLLTSTLLALAYIFLGRRLIKQKLVVLTHKTNIDKLIGATGVVVRSITPDTAGMVRLSDEDWRATSSEVLYERDRVEVISLEGVSLVVKKI